MSMRAYSFVQTNSAGTGTANILVQAIDVKAYDSFSLCLQNGLSGVAISSVIVLGAIDPSASFDAGPLSNSVPNWVKLDSNTFRQQSSDMAASSTIQTSAIKNAWHYIRVTGGITATSIANVQFRAVVTGFVK